jgi:hypothetical protein
MAVVASRQGIKKIFTTEDTEGKQNDESESGLIEG